MRGAGGLPAVDFSDSLSYQLHTPFIFGSPPPPFPRLFRFILLGRMYVY